jgi:hypothetical protein
MSVERDKRDMARLLRTLRSMDRTDVAQFMAQAVDEMVAEKMPDDIIRATCSELCHSLGISGEEVRRALH